MPGSATQAKRCSNELGGKPRTYKSDACVHARTYAHMLIFVPRTAGKDRTTPHTSESVSRRASSTACAPTQCTGCGGWVGGPLGDAA